MMEIITLTLGATILAGFGYFIFSRMLALTSAKAHLESENKALQEKLETQKQEIVNLQKTAQTEFKNIANEILKTNSRDFSETNKLNIEALLKPLKDNIANFEKKVSEETKERFSLGEHVKNLMLETNKISSEANNLASALKGQNKKQGNWGEMILETILQNSGLMRDIHYSKEENFKNEEGKNRRPDFIVRLPNDRAVIIDSKVSLVAYEKFYSAENQAAQELHLKDHLASIYQHIKILSEKTYHDLATSLDFTLMFIPIEPAYLAALQGDSELWIQAYQKRILLTSPTNLIACLKLINELWRREEQSKNQEKILHEAGKLYDKFAGFIDSMDKVGRQIIGTQNAFDEAFKQLSSGKGNLISRVENLRKLGLKTTKNIKIISEKILPSELPGPDSGDDAELSDKN